MHSTPLIPQPLLPRERGEGERSLGRCSVYVGVLPKRRKQREGQARHQSSEHALAPSSRCGLSKDKYNMHVEQIAPVSRRPLDAIKQDAPVLVYKWSHAPAFYGWMFPARRRRFGSDQSG